MSDITLRNASRQSLKILQWQIAWVIAAAAVSAAIGGVRTGWSVLTGGGIGFFWTAYMAFTLYKHSLNKARQPGAASFVTAWLVKLVFTLGFMVIAFRSGVMAPLGLIAGLFVALLAYWVRLAFWPPHRQSAARRANDGSSKG